MNTESLEALQAVAQERGISIDTLLGALADAIESGYKSKSNAHENAWVVIERETMEIRVMAQDLDDEDNPVGEEKDVTPDDFGRIAAQATRQIMTQRIREVEWEQKYEEYANREGDIVTGIIQQDDARYTLLDLGRIEALLPLSEQSSYEKLSSATRIKAYIVEVRRTAKDPQVVVSRTHPGLIKRLFELEVPEIAEGVVEIKACAREPGQRTKIAVYSNNEDVDPVGACVGARGVRVRPVVNELMGEKIDIIPFVEDAKEFVKSALQPARVKEVEINEEENIANVIVPARELSLAIGREGLNARLAARLTGLRIDVRSDDEKDDWARGEWIVNENGEQVFRPADGGPDITVEEWQKLSEEASAETESAAATGAAATESEPAAEQKADGSEPAESETEAEPDEKPAEENDSEPETETDEAESDEPESDEPEPKTEEKKQDNAE